MKWTMRDTICTLITCGLLSFYIYMRLGLRGLAKQMKNDETKETTNEEEELSSDTW